MMDLVCPSCACLCDDIRVEVEGEKITRIENACAKGSAFLYACLNPRLRAPHLVEGKPVPLEVAAKEAVRLLASARRPLVFGLDNSLLEAQAQGIRLARALGAVLDDTSTFCQGAVVEKILKGELPSVELSLAPTQADLLLYWGSNPYHSHPRHLAKYTYYTRKRYQEAGWTPEVGLAAVEVRETEMAALCRPFIKITPGEDWVLLRDTLRTLRGELVEDPEAKTLAELLTRSHLAMLFVGLGLVYALDNDLAPLVELAEEMEKAHSHLAVVPMVGHYNSVGLNYLLYQETGFVNRVSFHNGISHGPQFSFLEQVRQRQPDVVLVVGSNPFSSLPHSLMKGLLGVPLICLDPLYTPTAAQARVVIGTAVSGLEVGGQARRMDGALVELRSALPSSRPSDAQVLGRLLEGLAGTR